MSEQKDHYQSLVKLFLPNEIFDYFEIVNLVVADRTISVFLDEKDIKPVIYKDKKLTSKGFHPESIIQDFPIRNKAVFLHVRRRRWLIESTGEVVSREWDSVAEGTHYTKSFADFLKGIFGQLPH
jgi:hypothetical protein